MSLVKKLSKILLFILIACIIITGVGFVYVYYGNTVVRTTPYIVTSKKIPFDFDGYKIGVVSDFHNGKNYKQIFSNLKRKNVDIIVVIGDEINGNETTFDNTKTLLKGLVTIAPTYMVAGNHERWASQKTYDALVKFAKETGVQYLDNSVVELTKNRQIIYLAGFRDELYSDDKLDMFKSMYVNDLEGLYTKLERPDKYSIVLFHRGNLIEMPADAGFDLILSGHTHGGIINLPYFRNKVLLSHVYSDTYCKGQYTLGDSTAIISGGLECNKKEIRINNNPEVVIVTLRSQI